jgi:hypothetical protein
MDMRWLQPALQTLTVCYHITHQKINIRKETSTSLNVFSIASYISMLTLLVHIHVYQPNYPDMPLTVWARDIWRDAREFGSRISVAVEHRELWRNSSLLSSVVLEAHVLEVFSYIGPLPFGAVNGRFWNVGYSV